MIPELNKIYQGDCLEIMKDWPDSCVDVVITDPPYGEKTHAGARTGEGREKLITFSSVTPEYMVDLARRLCFLSRRWVIMTCDWRHCAEIEKQCPEIFIRAGVWIKPNPMPQMTGDRPSTGWEAIAILHRKGKKSWNGRGGSAVFNFNKISGEHPTQKPLDFIVRLVHLFSNEGEIILDPFCGSGTTLVAAHKMDRSFVGIEMDEKYVALTKDRIRAETDQPRLI